MNNTAMKPAASRLYGASSLLCARTRLKTTPIIRKTMYAFSQMSDNDPKVLEEEKNKQMSKKEKAWAEKLATHSEAAIKADKDEEKSTEQLQKESLKGLKDEK